MDEYINQNLGLKIKELRLKNEMTQDDIAELLNMNRSSFSKYENSVANPPLLVLRKLAKIFNVRLEYFINDEVNVLNFNENDDGKEPEIEEEIISSFTDLTQPEKMVVMRMRLMTEEKRKAFIEYAKEQI